MTLLEVQGNLLKLRLGKRNIFLQYLSKFPRADWLVAIVYKSTDNKNDVRCNERAFSTKKIANSARTFSMLL